MFVCRECGAWRLFGKPVKRTRRTDTCVLCDPDGWTAWRHSQIDLTGEWLRGAPRYTAERLREARAVYEQLRATAVEPDETPAVLKARDQLGRSLAPWVDTLDLDRAKHWCYERTDGLPLDWPPATDDALKKLAKFLGRAWVGTSSWSQDVNWHRSVVPDIGAVFGRKGFPYPPAPHHPHETEYGWSVWLEAGFSHLRDYLGEPGSLPGQYHRKPSLSRLPEGYRDVLTLTFELHDLSGNETMTSRPYAKTRYASGSIYRDDPGRVVVLWR